MIARLDFLLVLEFCLLNLTIFQFRTNQICNCIVFSKITSTNYRKKRVRFLESKKELAQLKQYLLKRQKIFTKTTNIRS